MKNLIWFLVVTAAILSIGITYYKTVILGDFEAININGELEEPLEE